MRLPRFTTRRLMVIVAVVGLFLCGKRLAQNWLAFRERAAIHQWYAEFYDGEAIACRAAANDTGPIGRQGPSGKAFLREKANGFDAMVNHHSHLALKYLRAARQPWLPVAPDPPAPAVPDFLRGASFPTLPTPTPAFTPLTPTPASTAPAGRSARPAAKAATAHAVD